MPAIAPIIILVVIALIVIWITQRFSPDPLITKIITVIVFVVVLLKLLPMLGIQ